MVTKGTTSTDIARDQALAQSTNGHSGFSSEWLGHCDVCGAAGDSAWLRLSGAAAVANGFQLVVEPLSVPRSQARGNDCSPTAWYHKPQRLGLAEGSVTYPEFGSRGKFSAEFF